MHLIPVRVPWLMPTCLKHPAGCIMKKYARERTTRPEEKSLLIFKESLIIKNLVFKSDIYLYSHIIHMSKFIEASIPTLPTTCTISVMVFLLKFQMPVERSSASIWFWCIWVWRVWSQSDKRRRSFHITNQFKTKIKYICVTNGGEKKTQRKNQM